MFRYATTTDLVDDFFETVSAATRPYTPNIYSRVLKDGVKKITVNLVGRSVDDIELTSNEEKITIKSSLDGDDLPYFVLKNINVSFNVGKDYDGTNIDAHFSNGLLDIYVDKKQDKKTTKVKIKS